MKKNKILAGAMFFLAWRISTKDEEQPPFI
jgi:hypothetical protein